MGNSLMTTMGFVKKTTDGEDEIAVYYESEDKGDKITIIDLQAFESKEIVINPKSIHWLIRCLQKIKEEQGL